MYIKGTSHHVSKQRHMSDYNARQGKVTAKFMHEGKLKYKMNMARPNFKFKSNSWDKVKKC